MTQILDRVEGGSTDAEEALGDLLPLAYAELRKMAANLMANERAGHTLQPTALVHEAYLRLAEPDGQTRPWNSRGHFFAAAAEAMRRILIDDARRKMTQKRGARAKHTVWDDSRLDVGGTPEELIAIDEALTALEEADPHLAKVVKLRYFAGLTIPETGAALEISPRSVNRQWKCARAWLYREISGTG